MAKSKSLRQIIKKPVSREAFWRTIDGVVSVDSHADLRNSVIIQTALLEVGLERLLRSRMRHKFTSDEENGLFGPMGIMSGFAAKIRAAYAFGIIGPITREDLATLNDIRNVFAHSPHTITMKNRRLWARVKSLHIAQFFVKGGYMDDSRGKRVSIKSKSAGLLEALTGYGIMLCVDRHKRVMLPPTRTTFVGWKKGNTLRY